MRLLKPVTVLAMLVILVASCKEDLPTIISRHNLPMDGSQEVPAKAVSGTGTLDIAYNQSTRILSYTVKWNGLTGPVTGFHIHGPAGRGFNAPVRQGFSGYPTTISGTHSGTLLIDGVLFTEEDLFRGGLYVNIHTTANPGGEIRGQIDF